MTGKAKKVSEVFSDPKDRRIHELEQCIAELRREITTLNYELKGFREADAKRREAQARYHSKPEVREKMKAYHRERQKQQRMSLKALRALLDQGRLTDAGLNDQQVADLLAMLKEERGEE
jgi:hypothetical protein